MYVLHDGVEENYELADFRARIRTHVREELERVSRATGRGAIDLGRIAEAEKAAAEHDHVRVIELLGAWPAPLAIFLRTPEGQMLNPDTRALIAQGLGLLGSACIKLGEVLQGRRGPPPRGAVCERRGSRPRYFHPSRDRDDAGWPPRGGDRAAPARREPGRRRGARLAAARPAFLERGRLVAAYGAVLEARAAGVAEEDLATTNRRRGAVGNALSAWRAFVEKTSAELARRRPPRGRVPRIEDSR